MFYNSGKQAWTSSKDKQAVVGIVDIGRALFFTCGSCFHVEKTVPRRHVGCALWATVEKFLKIFTVNVLFLRYTNGCLQ